MRELAESMLDPAEKSALAARHSAHYASVAVGASASISRRGGAAVLERVLVELDNILAVISRGLDEGAPVDQTLEAVRTLIAFDPVFTVRGPHASVAAFLDRAIDGPAAARADAGQIADLLSSRGRARHRQGLLAEAERDFLRAIDLGAGDRARRARARGPLAYLYLEQGRRADAHAALDRALDEVGEDDPATLGDLLMKSGCAGYMEGRMAEAQSAFERSISVWGAAGLDRMTGYALSRTSGLVQTSTGHAGAARASHERALAVARDFGDRRLEAVSLGNLSLVRKDHGERAEAREAIGDAIRVLREIGDRHHGAEFIADLGTLYFEDGALDEARSQYRAALDLLAGGNPPRIAQRIAMLLGAAEAALGRGDPARSAFDARRAPPLRRGGDPHAGVAPRLSLRARRRLRRGQGRGRAGAPGRGRGRDPPGGAGGAPRDGPRAGPPRPPDRPDTASWFEEAPCGSHPRATPSPTARCSAGSCCASPTPTPSAPASRWGARI